MDKRLVQADELGLRLEIVGGLPIWEPHPVLRHQRAIDRIRATIVPSASTGEGDGECACISLTSILVFPMGR